MEHSFGTTGNKAKIGEDREVEAGTKGRIDVREFRVVSESLTGKYVR